MRKLALSLGVLAVTASLSGCLNTFDSDTLPEPLEDGVSIEEKTKLDSDFLRAMITLFSLDDPGSDDPLSVDEIDPATAMDIDQSQFQDIINRH